MFWNTQPQKAADESSQQGLLLDSINSLDTTALPKTKASLPEGYVWKTLTCDDLDEIYKFLHGHYYSKDVKLHYSKALLDMVFHDGETFFAAIATATRSSPSRTPRGTAA